MYPLVLVVVLTEDKGIGKNNRLPWYPASLSADMCWFRNLTQSRFHADADGISFTPSTENIVVMGRKTWDSIPPRFRPLSGRMNVIMSRTKKTSDMKDAAFISDFKDLSYLCSLKTNPIVFVVGGHDIYNLAIMSGNAKFIFATEVVSQDKPLGCDIFFPSNDWDLYKKKDITREASECIDPKIRSSCYKEDLNVFFECNMEFKMFLYTRSDGA